MKDTIVSLTKELVEIPSVMEDLPHLVTALEWVKGQLPGYAFTPYVSENFPSLLYTNKPDETKNFKIILNAHLDVVPGGVKQFKPFEKEGRLYGRGVYDMKAATVVMLLVFKELAHKLAYPLGLQITTTEEYHGNLGTGYQVQQGVKAAFALTGECNSNFQVTNQAKGRMLGKVIITGETAHSAYAWKGKNAIIEMYNALAPLLKAYPHPTEATDETTINITRIKTYNEATNRIPDKCSVYLDIRYTKQDSKTIIQTIQSLLPTHATFEANRLHEAHLVNPDNPYILQLQRLVKTIRREDLPLRHAAATSDATFLKEAVEFGPVGGNAHAEDEWVDIQSLEDYYYILKNFLLELDKQN